MNKYTENQIQDTLKIIESSIINCEKIQPKLKVGSPQLSLSKNRIKALYISKSLLLHQECKFSKEEIDAAIVQMTSIKNKSTTGLNHAKIGTGTYNRFSRLIAAMDIILEYLNQNEI